MSNFAETLKQNNQFRRDFNRVLTFSNWLSIANRPVTRQQDPEAGTTSSSNHSNQVWFFNLMRSFTSPTPEATTVATAMQLNDLVWQDTLIFLEDIKNCDKRIIKEKILNFIIKTINNTDISEHLTPEQKELIIDKLFADPYKNARAVLKIRSVAIALATTLLAIYLIFKLLTSYDQSSKSYSLGYALAVTLSLGVCLASYIQCEHLRRPLIDPVAEDAASLMVWANELSNELLRLQIPCDSPAESIAIGTLTDIEASQNSLITRLLTISRLFNIATISNNALVSYWVESNSYHFNSLLQDNQARRRLDYVIKFISDKATVNSLNNADNSASAVKLYSQIKSNTNNMMTILQTFLDDCKQKIHESTKISDLDKNLLLDLILINPASKKHFINRNRAIGVVGSAQLIAFLGYINASNITIGVSEVCSLVTLIAYFIDDCERNQAISQNSDHFKLWLYEMEQLCKRLTTIVDPIEIYNTAGDVSANVNNDARVQDCSYKKRGYALMPYG